MDRSNDKNGLIDDFTILNGVKVIEVYASAYITYGTEHIISLTVESSSSGQWIYNTGEGNTNDTVYVGVTPNKKYYIRTYAETREGEDCKIDRLYIKYSSEINKKTPTVTDY